MQMQTILALLSASLAFAASPVFNFDKVNGGDAQFYLDLSKCSTTALPGPPGPSDLLPSRMKQFNSSDDTPLTLSIEVKNYGQIITFPLCGPYISKARMEAYTKYSFSSYAAGLCTITLPWDTVDRTGCFKTDTNKVDVDTKLTATLGKISASVTHALHVDFTGEALKTKVDSKSVVGVVTADFVMESLEYEKNGALVFKLGATVNSPPAAYFGVRFVEGITAKDDAPALTRVRSTDFTYSTIVPCKIGSVAKAYSYTATAFSCFNGVTSKSEENDSDDECHSRYPQAFTISFTVDPTCTISYEINNKIVDAALTYAGSITTTKLFPDKPWKLTLNSTFLAGLSLNINVKGISVTYGTTVKSGPVPVTLDCFTPVQSKGNTVITFTPASLKIGAQAPTTIGCAIEKNKLEGFVLPNINTYTLDIALEFVSTPATYRRRDDAGPKTGSATVTVAVESISKLASDGLTIGGGLIGSALAAGAALLF
ncbi:hypothetical protein BJ741DRAFT_712388 [Chytriomyces cf. hyalinus JEL632]|nr:hypothetical protein BJ741DRAFT_712388 [Chytriomyces cf. hyalinus JEL632]